MVPGPSESIAHEAEEPIQARGIIIIIPILFSFAPSPLSEFRDQARHTLDMMPRCHLFFSNMERGMNISFYQLATLTEFRCARTDAVFVHRLGQKSHIKGL